jgi:hypothetical protein
VRAPSGASSPLDPGRDIPLRVAATLPFPAPSGGGEASLAGEGPEGGEEPRADEGGAQGPRPGEAGAPEEDQGEGAAAFEKLRESFRRAGGRWRRAAEGLEVARGYWRRYGRVARKLLRAVLLLGRGMLLVPRFKLFDARYSIGGDPAALGMALGWHHALLATIHPRLSRHIVFEPDFEERELAPRGSLHLVVVVWPWRFIPPILAFVARLPWLGLFKLAWREILAKRRQRSRPRT